MCIYMYIDTQIFNSIMTFNTDLVLGHIKNLYQIFFKSKAMYSSYFLIITNENWK